MPCIVGGTLGPLLSLYFRQHLFTSFWGFDKVNLLRTRMTKCILRERSIFHDNASLGCETMEGWRFHASVTSAKKCGSTLDRNNF